MVRHALTYVNFLQLQQEKNHLPFFDIAYQVSNLMSCEKKPQELVLCAICSQCLTTAGDRPNLPRLLHTPSCPVAPGNLT